MQLALLRLWDTGIRHHPIRHEMSLEKSFRKPQRLWPCKEQFLSLLNLFLSLRVEFVHSIEKRATNSSRACSHVQSGASMLRRPKTSRLRTLVLQLRTRGSSSATALACPAIDADAAGASTDDFV